MFNVSFLHQVPSRLNLAFRFLSLVPTYSSKNILAERPQNHFYWFITIIIIIIECWLALLKMCDCYSLVTFWLVHLIWHTSPDLVYVVFLSSTYRLPGLVSTSHDMTSSVGWTAVLLSNWSFSVSWQRTTKGSRFVFAVDTGQLSDTTELYTRLWIV